tara:strand:- start:3501 stop:3842 length:342 start_codon:yes stop_codon:yes gene_type:complete
MAKLEVFQNGTSMHPDTMGDPVYQIGSKNPDGGYDVVVFDAMTEKEAKDKLKELRPVKAVPNPEPVAKKAPAKKKVVEKVKAVKKKKAAKVAKKVAKKVSNKKPSKKKKKKKR